MIWEQKWWTYTCKNPLFLEKTFPTIYIPYSTMNSLLATINKNGCGKTLRTIIIIIICNIFTFYYCTTLPFWCKWFFLNLVVCKIWNQHKTYPFQLLLSRIAVLSFPLWSVSHTHTLISHFMSLSINQILWSSYYTLWFYPPHILVKPVIDRNKIRIFLII